MATQAGKYASNRGIRDKNNQGQTSRGGMKMDVKQTDVWREKLEQKVADPYGRGDYRSLKV